MTQQLFTLADARTHNACEDGYNRFKAALTAAYPDADIETIRWSIGDVAAVYIDDALWCFRLLDDRRAMVGAVMPAVNRVSKHATDQRVHDCIAAIDRWLAGGDVDFKGATAAAFVAAARAADYAAAHLAAARDATPATERTAAHLAAARAAARAADAANAAAYAARATYSAAAWAAHADADAAAAAYAARAAASAAEIKAQRQDLIAAFPRTFGETK